MTPRPTKKVHVYQILRQAIVTGEIRPGEILNEAQLAQKYNIGKTPTREALLLLTHERFLEAMPRLGYVVTRLTTQDLLEIYALRTLLETEAVGLAAERITPTEIRQLELNNEREAQLAGQDPREVARQAYQINYEFHTGIARAAGNNRLAKLIGELIDDLERALYFDPYIADPSQHREIIDSLRNHDRQRAQEAMRAHLTDTRLRILKVI